MHLGDIPLQIMMVILYMLPTLLATSQKLTPKGLKHKIFSTYYE